MERSLFLLLLFSSFAAADSINITNLGHTGFQVINSEYTPIVTVLIKVNTTSPTTACRYINHDTTAAVPGAFNMMWSPWEPCISQKYWQLNDTEGNKTVYCEVDYSAGPNLLFNDSIYYNSTGAGLDVTPPGAARVSDGEYTRDNSTLIASWEGAYDPESVIYLEIPLVYEYRAMYERGGANTTFSGGRTTQNQIIVNGAAHVRDGDRVRFNVTVINSAGLYNSSVSDGIWIDQNPPGLPVIDTSEFYNESASSFMDLGAATQWYNTKGLRFHWIAADASSGIGGYSYHLLPRNESPDMMPEGIAGELASEQGHTFEGVSSGIWYLAVRSVDNAGNWGSFRSREIRIDNTPPERPVLMEQSYDSETKSTTYRWSPSSDISGISGYVLNITYPDGTIYRNLSLSAMTTQATVPTETGGFIVRIGARNRAGLWRWSDEEDIVEDTTVPGVETSTSGKVLRPRIRIETTEDSDCHYMYSGSNHPFKYTGGTYHETELQIPPGPAAIPINCTDAASNMNDSLVINIDYDPSAAISSVTAPDLYGFYGSISQFLARVTDGTDGIGGIPAEYFNVTILGQEQEISVLDEGGGYYLVKARLPQKAGTFAARLEVNSTGQDVTAYINPLNLTLGYTDGVSAWTSSAHTAYHKDASACHGLATYDDQGHMDAGPGEISYTTSGTLPSFIFICDPAYDPSEADRYLMSKEFLDRDSHTFGSPRTDRIVVSTILKYSSFRLVGDRFTLRGARRIELEKQKGGDISVRGVN